MYVVCMCERVADDGEGASLEELARLLYTCRYISLTVDSDRD